MNLSEGITGINEIKVDSIINDQFIRKAFSIDIEKKEVPDTEYLGDIEFDGEGLTIQIFKLEAERTLNDFPNDAFIKMNYAYEGTDTIQVFRNIKRIETDREILDRLKIIAREVKTELREKEKAKKILGLEA